MITKRFGLLLASCVALGMGSSTAFSQSSQSQWYTGLNIASTGYIGEVKTYGGNNAGIFTSNDVGPNTVPAAELSAFFNGVFLPGNMNGDPTDGSGVKATFSLQGTTSLAVKYQLITNEDIGSGYDRAFVYIDGRQYTLGNNSLANTPGLSPSNSNAAGLVNATRPVALLVTGLTPGLHTVGFGVYDTEDTEVTSGLLLSRLPDVGGALAVAVDQREVLLGITQTATRDVGGRLFMLRAEADDFDAGVTTLALTTGVSDGKSTVDAKDGKEGKSIVQAPERPTVELYTAGDYGYGDRDNTIGLADFTSDTYVGSVGVEVHLNHHLTLGLAYSHIENRTDFADGIGQLRIRGDAITPYVSFAMDHFYTEALYSYSKFDDETYLTGGNATPASENHTVNLDLGYNFTYGHLVTGPIFALNYTTGNLDGYTAGGGGGTSLVAGQQSYDSLITRLGWQASYKMPTHFGAITPQIRASWDRENLDNSDTVSVGLGGIETETLNAGTGLITAGAPATATTASPDRDYLNVGAGVLMQCGSRGSLIVDYEDHLFRNSYSERFATVKIGFTF